MPRRSHSVIERNMALNGNKDYELSMLMVAIKQYELSPNKGNGMSAVDRKTQAKWSATRQMLNSAEFADYETVIRACDKAERVFDEYGYPDWWSLVERMRSDAVLNHNYPRLPERI